MSKWRFWPSREEQELVKLRWKIVELEGRLKKQDQFIRNLAKKYPEVNADIFAIQKALESLPESLTTVVISNIKTW